MNYMNNSAILNNTGEWQPSCAGVQRGDIWEVHDLAEGGKAVSRKVAIISQESENATKPYVLAVRITDTVYGRPRPSRFTVMVDGETKFIICETIHRVNRERLISRIGTLTNEERVKLNAGICHAVGVSGDDLACLVADDIAKEFIAAIDTSDTTKQADFAKIEFERNFYKEKYEELLASLTATPGSHGVHRGCDQAEDNQRKGDMIGGYTNVTRSDYAKPDYARSPYKRNNLTGGY